MLELFPVVLFLCQSSQATVNNGLPLMTGSPAFLTRPPLFTGVTETVSANWIAVERFKMSQITFISIHIHANQNSYDDDKST